MDVLGCVRLSRVDQIDRPLGDRAASVLREDDRPAFRCDGVVLYGVGGDEVLRQKPYLQFVCPDDVADEQVIGTRVP
jgi:hypothetical protein